MFLKTRKKIEISMFLSGFFIWHGFCNVIETSAVVTKEKEYEKSKMKSKLGFLNEYIPSFENKIIKERRSQVCML